MADDYARLRRILLRPHPGHLHSVRDALATINAHLHDLGIHRRMFHVTADIAAEHRAASRLLLELPLGDNTFIIILDTTIAPPETT